MTNPTPPNLDELVSRIMAALPGGLQDFKTDAEKNLKSALHIALGKMNLVTRDEFEVQKAVLARSREKLEELERLVAKLEKELGHQEAK